MQGSLGKDGSVVKQAEVEDEIFHLSFAFREFKFGVQRVMLSDFAPAGRYVYSPTLLESSSVGAQQPGALAGGKHISLLTERRLWGRWYAAINMSLLRSEAKFQVAPQTRIRE